MNMNMKNKSVSAVLRVAAMSLALLLPLASCNFFGLPEYELSIVVEEGVKGTPASSVQVLAELTEVEYDYTPVNYLTTVETIFDGDRAAASGTITMYKPVTLVARLVDIRDTWDLTVYKSDSTVLSTSTITFSGADILGGTFSDSRGYTGTWTGASNVIKITFPAWEQYILSGTLFSMAGTWANGSATGSWGANRAE